MIGTKMTATTNMIVKFSLLPAASNNVMLNSGLILDGSMFGNIPMNPKVIFAKIVTQTAVNAKPIFFLKTKNAEASIAPRAKVGTAQSIGYSV